MMPLYRLLALDLDGTLLGPLGTISAATRAAVIRAQTHGVAIVIATGRTFSMLRHFCYDLTLTAPQVTLNGAAIVAPDTGMPTALTPLPDAAVWPIVSFLEEDAFPTALFDFSRVWILRGNPYADRVVPPGLGYPELLANWHDFRQRPTGNPLQSTTKIVAIDSPRRIDHLRPRAEQAFGKDFYVAQTADHLLEFHHPAVSKGAGLAAVAAQLGIARAQIVACGDSHNDISMLHYAACGVAMGNASAEVKAIATYTAPSNAEDGIVWVIDRLLNGTL